MNELLPRYSKRVTDGWTDMEVQSRVLEPTPTRFSFLFGIYTDMVLLPEEPSEIASEVGISRIQGGVLIIVFN